MAILSLSASGMASLLVAEPCGGYEPPGHSDDVLSADVCDMRLLRAGD